MAEIAPFRALRYNSEKVGDFTDVVSLPYDKITSQLREKYTANPHNIAHVIKPVDASDDADPLEKYKTSANTLKSWIEEKVLTRDEKPSFYVYHQHYKLPDGSSKVRKGFITLLELREFGDGVYPHETTFPGPKEDRLRLMEATNCNFGQIFGLFSDESQKVSELLDKGATEDPIIDISLDSLNEKHRVWQISDPALVESLRTSFSGVPVFIADGHHRYETALHLYREKKKQDLSEEALRPYGYRMMTLVDMDSEGLTILPTHRAVKLENPLTLDELKLKLGNYFYVESLSTGESGDRQEAAELWLNGAEDKTRMVAVLPHKDPIGIELIDRDKLKEVDLVDELKSLDVAVLHKVILEQAFQIDTNQKDEGVKIGYIREINRTFRLVDDGDYAVAFLLNPTTVEELRSITTSGHRMPQKSTDFYPKMLSGLTVYEMDSPSLA